MDIVEILCTPNLRLNDHRFQIDAFWRTNYEPTDDCKALHPLAEPGVDAPVVNYVFVGG